MEERRIEKERKLHCGRRQRSTLPLFVDALLFPDDSYAYLVWESIIGVGRYSIKPERRTGSFDSLTEHCIPLTIVMVVGVNVLFNDVIAIDVLSALSSVKLKTSKELVEK